MTIYTNHFLMQFSIYKHMYGKITTPLFLLFYFKYYNFLQRKIIKVSKETNNKMHQIVRELSIMR